MSVALIAIRQLVRDRIGVPPHDEFFTDTVLDSNINMALTVIESEHRWPWNERIQELILDPTAKFTVPDDWRATRSITTQYNDLIEMTFYDMRTRFPGNQAAEPTHYALMNREIWVRAIPQGNIEAMHQYYASPILLSADTDQPSLPTEHINTLVAKTAQLCSVREDDRPSADSHLAEYLQGIERMRKDVRGTTRPQPPRVRPGGWL